MALFDVTLTERLRVTIEADCEERAQAWAMTHSINDVCEMTKRYDIEYEEEVEETNGDELDAAITVC